MHRMNYLKDQSVNLCARGPGMGLLYCNCKVIEGLQIDGLPSLQRPMQSIKQYVLWSIYQTSKITAEVADRFIVHLKSILFFFFYNSLISAVVL